MKKHQWVSRVKQIVHKAYDSEEGPSDVARLLRKELRDMTCLDEFRVEVSDRTVRCFAFKDGHSVHATIVTATGD